ncbi:unnamed protein product, partial [Amoebophrya sp. A120]
EDSNSCVLLRYKKPKTLDKMVLILQLFLFSYFLQSMQLPLPELSSPRTTSLGSYNIFQSGFTTSPFTSQLFAHALGSESTESRTGTLRVNVPSFEDMDNFPFPRTISDSASSTALPSSPGDGNATSFGSTTGVSSTVRSEDRTLSTGTMTSGRGSFSQQRSTSRGVPPRVDSPLVPAPSRLGRTYSRRNLDAEEEVGGVLVTPALSLTSSSAGVSATARLPHVVPIGVPLDGAHLAAEGGVAAAVGTHQDSSPSAASSAMAGSYYRAEDPEMIVPEEEEGEGDDLVTKCV